MIQARVVVVAAEDGYPLHCRYWQVPSASAVMIFTHGIVSHSLWLAEIADALASRGISCLLADRRGAGMNQQDRGDAPNARTLIDDVLAVSRFARTENVPLHWCGFCWGANQIVNAVPHAPDYVRSIALLAPSLFPTARITDQDFRSGDSAEPTELPTMPIECFTDGPAFEALIKPDPLRLTLVSQRLNAIMQEFSQGLWMKFLRVTLPTLVLLGADDEVVDNDATVRLFGRLRCSPRRIDTLPGKHGIQFDSPQDIVTHLLEWVALTGLSSPESHMET